MSCRLGEYQVMETYPLMGKSRHKGYQVKLAVRTKSNDRISCLLNYKIIVVVTLFLTSFRSSLLVS